MEDSRTHQYTYVTVSTQHPLSFYKGKKVNIAQQYNSRFTAEGEVDKLNSNDRFARYPWKVLEACNGFYTGK